MTVTELITNFRAGLLGLLPSIECVGIPWKRPEAYDEWDNLATAVYQALIVEPLRSSLPNAEQERSTSQTTTCFSLAMQVKASLKCSLQLPIAPFVYSTHSVRQRSPSTSWSGDP